jgi:hypothetical protein
MKRLILAVAISATMVGAIGTGSVSAKKDPACTITPAPAAVGQPFTVNVSGLPTNVPITLWVTDAAGGTLTSGLLGTAPGGSFSLTETAGSVGTWSYQFAGPMKNGSAFVYSTCAVSVQ